MKLMLALLSALGADERGSLSSGPILGECACCGEALLLRTHFRSALALKTALADIAVSYCPFAITARIIVLELFKRRARLDLDLTHTHTG